MPAKSTEELKAIAYALADEIETRAAPRIAAGMRREQALTLSIIEMSNKAARVKG